MGAYIAETRAGGSSIVCVCKCECERDTEKQLMCVLRERGQSGRFCYASCSQYACRSGDVWLLWLAVPCVTAFKNRLPREMSSLQALAARCRG